MKRSISELAAIITATMADDGRAYSMVRKLALDVRAVAAASSGNVEVSLLNELLNEIRGRRGQAMVSYPSKLPMSLPANSQDDLKRLLVGTTWRKKNDLEHVIFHDESTFYNNHAGHPTEEKFVYAWARAPVVDAPLER